MSTPKIGATPAHGLYVDPVFSVSRTIDRAVYGRAVNENGVLQDLVLNIYRPVGASDYDTPFERSHRPVIVWAPGGGFVFNRGRAQTYWMPDLVRRGYVVVSIEYRVRPDLPYGATGFVTNPVAFLDLLNAARDGQHDMQAAIRWVRKNARRLGVDEHRVVAAGYSAGAIESLEVAFNASDPGTSGNPGYRSDVAAAIAGAGAYLPGFMGSIDPGEPPILLMHGTSDTTVPVPGSLIPCAATLAVGNVCEAHIYPGETHDLGIERPADMLAFSVDFLYRNLIARASRLP